MKVKLDDYEVRVLINGLIQPPFACVTLLKQ